jgi:hypothetical protein
MKVDISYSSNAVKFFESLTIAGSLEFAYRPEF